jgi:putative AlgH/UPF0301 family transcriptional regulator
MSLRKLCLFAALATVVSFVAVGTVNRPAPKSEALPISLLPVQSKNIRSLGTGKVLVASRDLGDPNFVKTVILLVRYDPQGVVGLVLNRRSHVPLSRVLKDLKAAKDRSDPVYLGGPVETPAVFALLQSAARVEGAEHISGAIYLISAKPLFEQTISTRPDPGVFHVYLGYAGWTEDQLRREVELGAWYIFPAEAGTVFNSDPDSLWPQMIGKTELKMAGTEPAGADLIGEFVNVTHSR